MAKCKNVIYLNGPLNTLREILATNLSLSRLVPLPDDLDISNIELLKSWRLENWGTTSEIIPADILKIEDCSIEDNKIFCIQNKFTSENSPPAQAFQYIFENFKSKNLDVRLDYFIQNTSTIGAAYNRGDDFIVENYEYHNLEELEFFINKLGSPLGGDELNYLRELDAEEESKLKKPNLKFSMKPDPIVKTKKKPGPSRKPPKKKKEKIKVLKKRVAK